MMTIDAESSSNSGKAKDKRRDGAAAETVRSSKRHIGNPADARKVARLRRKALYELLKEKFRYPVAQFLRRHDDLRRSALDSDIVFFQSHGIRFKIRNENGQEMIVDESARSNEAGQSFFGPQRIPEKKLVAKLCASLVLGQALKKPLGECSRLESCCTHDELLTALSRQPNANEITRLLWDYWREPSRMLALDSASTNEQTALLLSGLQLPAPDSSLAYLTICTNSREIFNIIGNVNVPIRAIVTGGAQRGQNGTTLAGALTEFFLRHAALLHFGMACIGATGIDIASGTCHTDSQEEMLIKQAFFSKATIRVVALDSSKIKDPFQRHGYAFASINPKQLDLIVTNSPLTVKAYKQLASQSGTVIGKQDIEEQQRIIDRFDHCMSQLSKREVPILIATSDFTERSEQYTGSIRIDLTPVEIATMGSMG